MTYQDLLVMIQKLTQEQCLMNVVVKQDNGEFIPVCDFRVVGDQEPPLNFAEEFDADGILDPGHPVLICTD